MLRVLLIALALLVSPAARAMDWTAPGVAPFTGTDERAIHLLASAGHLTATARQALAQKMSSGGCYRDNIPDGYAFTRMLFGKGTVVPNVRAMVSQWQSGTTQVATFCEHREGGRVYILVRPDVCGNWSLVVLDIQGRCVEDKTVCDGDCQRIRRVQAPIRRRG